VLFFDVEQLQRQKNIALALSSVLPAFAMDSGAKGVSVWRKSPSADSRIKTPRHYARPTAFC
jgi:hypothetical protein